MEKTACPSVGPKVSQIATIFQKKPVEVSSQESLKETPGVPTVAVVRTESHAARFNNARALFEKLGVENHGHHHPSHLSVKLPHSSSREDFLYNENTEPPHLRSPSPKRKQYPTKSSSGGNITNGVAKIETKILNFRGKNEKPEKPEKPERKFNSKELIEKQKNWTSHFTKTRTTRFNSDPNRCDIIRTVPGTTLISANEINSSTNLTREQPIRSSSFTASKQPVNDFDEPPPPSPPHRQPPPPPPPEIKPRVSSKSITSPTKVSPIIISTKHQQTQQQQQQHHFIQSPTKTSNLSSPIHKKHDGFGEIIQRKKSIDDDLTSQKHSDSCINITTTTKYPDLNQLKKSGYDSGLVSPAYGISSSPSPAPSASSGPSSPNHTEDEKQENEDNEKPIFRFDHKKSDDKGDNNGE